MRAFLVRLGFANGKDLSNVMILILLAVISVKYLKNKASIQRMKPLRQLANRPIEKYKMKLNDLVFFSQILLITTIGNAFAWQHHFVFLFPGFIAATLSILRPSTNTSEVAGIQGLLRGGIWKQNNVIKLSLLLLSAILVGMHFPDIAHPPTSNPFLISHTLMGGLALFIMLLLA